MIASTVFIIDNTQAVVLPDELRLPDCVKCVDVRAHGNERIISPVGQNWDGFFMNGAPVTDDFMEKRETQNLAPKPM